MSKARRSKADAGLGGRKTLRVAMSRSRSEWLASGANFSASGHNSRTARRLIAAMIEERFGSTPIDVNIVLPKSVGALVQKYRDDEKLLRSLADAVPDLRVQCIRKLLALNLTQAEVADLMGMTRSHLAVALKRAQAPAPANGAGAPPRSTRRSRAK